MPATATDRLEGLTTSVAVKAPCRVATTETITLSGEQTVNGVAVVDGDRVLVRNQASSVDNGIYVCSTGAWTRAADFDGSRDGVDGTLIYVREGTSRSESFYRLSATNPVIIGTSAIAWTFIGGSPIEPIRITPQMFAEDGEDITDDVTDAYPAFVAAIEYIRDTLGALQPEESTQYRAAPALFVPFGTYYLSDTLDIEDVTLHMIGESAGSAQNGGNPVILRFAAGKTGIRIHFVNTTENTTRPAGVGAIGSVIENIKVTTWGDGGSTEADGFRIRAPCRLINCTATNFPRHGVNATGTINAVGPDADKNEGSANQVQIIGGQYWRNRMDGIFFDGADSSAGFTLGVSCNYNGRWGLFDSSFLANAHFAMHTSTNGMVDSGPSYPPGGTGKNTIGCMCSYSGQRYNVIPGQEAGASTNAPPGTASPGAGLAGASNTWWRWFGAGGTHPTIPAWVSGMTWQAGGAFRSDGANARCTFDGCYTEGDQGPAYVSTVSLIKGGTMGAGVATGCYIYTSNSLLRSETGFDSYWDNQAGIATTAQLGGEAQLLWKLTITGFQPWRTVYDTTNGNLQLNYQNSASLAPWNITGPLTNWQFGRGANVLHRMQVPEIFVGNTSASRAIGSAAATPAGPNGTGDFWINTTPGVTGIMAWQCHTAGTPGTWDPLYSGRNKVGVGYITGGGGTVTQSTSKSTGVTLNKICGQITMNNAALNAGVTVGFTLTNSTIAATDVVIVNIGSGATADSYTLEVDAVAAGSCRIQVRNFTAGNLSEALVINFAVIKAVAA